MPRRSRHSRPSSGHARPQPPPPVRPLDAQFHELARRYEALARRHAATRARRQGVVTLAMSAVRTSRSAMALLRDGELLVRNPAWNTLARGRSAWHAGDRVHAGLREVAAAQAAEMLGAGEVVREAHFERNDPPQVLSVRCERLARSGRPIVLVLARDVSDRARAEREVARAREVLAEQERMRAVGELASGVAHDLNNVLHAMALRLQAMRRQVRSGDALGGGVRALTRMVEDAASRVARLQDLAYRRHDAPAGDVELATVVREAVEAARPQLEHREASNGAPVTVETELPAMPPVRGSARELRDLFLSLLLNARDAMPDGGTVRVTAEVRGGRALVRVADQGHGIAPEVLPRIFDPFFTTKGHRGTGLGLAIARSVMLRLGGEIHAANAPTKGAVVELAFPVSRTVQSPAANSSPAATATPARPRCRVLVVDDDADVLEGARLVLEELGEEVETAASGRDAIARVTRGERFDVVLCDVGMPELNGWQVAAELRELLPGADVYLVTGWAHEIAPDDPRRGIVRDVLPKPLPLDRLEAIFAPSPVRAPAPARPPAPPLQAT